MKKNTKTVSYILVLSALLSSVQPAVAQTNWFNRARVRERTRTLQEQAYEAAQKFQARAVGAINNLEARIKNLLTQLDEYRKCVMSEEGCSKEQKATLKKAGWGLGAAVTVLLLYLFGRYERKQHRADVAKAREEGERATMDPVVRESGLWEAIRQNDVAAIRGMRRMSDLLQERDAQGMTPLMRAIVAGASSEVIGQLIHYSTPATINLVNAREGKTALDYADESKRADIIKDLGLNRAIRAKKPVADL